jgi:hypothetical protein
MERYVVAAELEPGKGAEAARMLAAGPPFDPSKVGLAAHAAYLTDDCVYLLFEGETARMTALEPARTYYVDVSQWQGVTKGLPSSVEDMPPDARCLYRWRAGESPS